MDTSLIDAAGVYYVAARLAAMGLKCAPTFGHVPSVDIVVSDSDGSASTALQVKTTQHALRVRGRGKDKKPHHYEWDINKRSAHLSAPNLFFALVDLKGFSELPDVYIVPSTLIAEYFNGGIYKRWRYHPLIDTIEEYRNGWNNLQSRLKDLKRQADRAIAHSTQMPVDVAENVNEIQLLDEARRGRESLKNLYLTEEDIRTAKHWGRE